MKIAVSSTGENLTANVDPRFGRCVNFIVIDTENEETRCISNGSAGAMGGAGIMAAQLVAREGIKVVLTGNVGPNAFGTLQAAGISVVTGVAGTVAEAVEKYRTGELEPSREPTVGGHHGTGGNRSGRGQGGRGRG